jgi:imidazolonepropionase-like amidohydrolase
MAAVAAALIVGASSGIRGQQPGALVVEGATLIDGTGAAPVPNSAIVIENGKITAAGPRSSVRVPAGARAIDAKGKFVIPGLIEGHNHYRAWMGELFLNNGVTTIFDLGNTADWILKVRDAEHAGGVAGVPHIFTAGAAINRPGGNFMPSFGANAGTPAENGPVKGPEWARDAAKAMIAKGVDVIKVTSDNLTAEEIGAITDEAHKAHLVVLGHVTDVYRYVGNGFDGIAHMWGVSSTLMTPENRKKWAEEGAIMNPYAYMDPGKIDALIAFMIQHHTTLMPMLVAEHSGVTKEARDFEAAVSTLYMDPELRYVPFEAVLTDMTIFRKDRSYSSFVGSFPYVESLDAAKLDEARRGYKNALDFTMRYAKAGGRVFAGTDSPGAATVPGMSVQQELILFVDAGFTPMQALQAGTRNTAEFYNKGDQVGTLQVGRFGDLLVLDANPLTDIRNIQKIHTVIKSGEVLERRYHRNYHPAFWTAEDDRYRGTSTAPAPVLASANKAAGGTLVAKGRNFHGTSILYLNDRPLDTSFVSITELRAKVPADLPQGGAQNVTVKTPWPGGGVSEAKPLAAQ